MKLATLCYIKKNKRTLMLHRNKRPGDIHAGMWNGLGGKLNPGESPEECVIREVREESGLRIKGPELKGFITFPGFDGIDDWYVFVYVCRSFTGKLGECNEGELQWIEDRRLLSLPLWEGDRKFLPWLEKDKFFSAKLVYKKKKLVSSRAVFY